VRPGSEQRPASVERALETAALGLVRVTRHRGGAAESTVGVVPAIALLPPECGDEVVRRNRVEIRPDVEFDPA